VPDFRREIRPVNPSLLKPTDMTKDIARRFDTNPLLKPGDLRPSRDGLEIACLLNPGVFRFQDKTWLIVRVAERPRQKEGVLSFPVLQSGQIRIMEISLADPELDASDARVINYKGNDYLTTLSHLRLLNSDDGLHFQEASDYPLLQGVGPLQSFGLEDCRVSQLGNTYHLTFTAVSENGVGVGLKTTENWKTFRSHGMMLPPHNKDCALFEEKIIGYFYAFHRPSSVDIGGNYIWIARSPDGVHWGDHHCIIRTRKDSWDEARVGAGAAPVKTDRGWLSIYHGANRKQQYCLGAFLTDLNDPVKVISRTEDPIMIPSAPYELSGFFGNVVFTNGHVLEPDGDSLTIYYGASDEFVCGARFSVNEICSRLKPYHD
jgi:predicted GH43/DUF377 family glycosyl hydrolase